MAKYTRFDPRNKKKNRHKKLNLDKVFRIHRVSEKTKDYALRKG